MKMSKAVDEILAELEKPIPPHHLKRTEKKMATASKKKASKKTAGKKTATRAPASAASSNEDLITLANLADEVGITTAKARQRLRAADIGKDGVQNPNP